MGRTIHAIINVSIQPADTEKFVNLVNNEPMVVECYHVTGNYSYLVKVDAYEITDLEKLVMRFQKMGNTNTQIIMSTTVKRKPIL